MESGRRRRKRVSNSPEGHEQLVAWLTASDAPVRLVLEATGNYSLDLALTVHASDNIELMVANPSATRQFAGAQMRRSKTDRVDADVLADFAARMAYVAWEPPKEAVLELRGIARRMQALTVERTRERARLHQAHVTRTTPAVVINDIEVNIRHLERRIDEMLRQALRIVRAHARLKAALARLTSLRGIAEKSAVMILPEILILPDDMSVRQWVAHAGLDPRKFTSGDSVEKRERISKVGNVRLRRALYMPALVAIRWEPNVGAFYKELIARGKKPIVAVVAVMRKLLHAIHGMFKHNANFDGQKFYRMPATA
jgi:transposase